MKITSKNDPNQNNIYKAIKYLKQATEINQNMQRLMKIC